ncbi:MAG: hypothetical protein H0U51_08790 [Propionibacteriales bacterium]|nr:hypothetical protein [Propionibacteriales bacterium]
MPKLTRPIALAAGTLAMAALGTTGAAFANAPSQTSIVHQESGDSAETEGAADQARQDVACTAAGIDPSASNINYDDETGVCTLDSGSDNDED